MIAFILMFVLSCFFGPDGFTSFLYTFLSSYVGHVILHDDLFYYLPYSILHRYHHEIHSPFSYFINILSECSLLTIALFLLPLNPWSMLFGALMFVTIHYINYSWLHINTYHEKLRAFTLPDFESMCAANQLSIVKTFGDYELMEYDQTHSPRLILIAKNHNFLTNLLKPIN
jgi:hypothetical protein